MRRFHGRATCSGCRDEHAACHHGGPVAGRHAGTSIAFDQRRPEPTLERVNPGDSSVVVDSRATKSHRAFRHQPSSAHLQAAGDVRADEGRGRGEEYDDAQF